MRDNTPVSVGSERMLTGACMTKDQNRLTETMGKRFIT